MDDAAIVVSEQRRELMAAEAVESDLDVAFRMQMEEAIAASLVTQSEPPSSSASSSHVPLKVEERDQDDLSYLMRLQTLELDRYQQESKDRELCQVEMRRISDDLKRHIHDSKFAREIHEIPDDEWEEYGDNFEKPIGSDCASSSSASAIEEPFKLYFKGWVSNEFVNDIPVAFSAIGIAICDQQDNPILKIHKPLTGVGLSRRIVEFKALIEGLNASLSLDIRNVDVFCDYVPLFNFVTRKWNPKQRKIANIISQIHIIQRKFDRCQMHLLPRCHVKFVFQLAKDVIDSQLKRTMEANDNVDLKETCSICLEDIDASQIFIVDGCLHHYCFSCMKQHVEVKLLHGVLPACPHDGCNMKLNVDTSRKFLSPRLVEMMTQRLEEASIPEADKLYCPYPLCSALMSRKEMMLPPDESSSKHPADYVSGLRKCVKCNRCFCLNCKVPWHNNMSCNEYKRFNPHPCAEDAKLLSLARQKLWRQCIKCKHVIELVDGCYHMTCRCGYEFCYTCGSEWINKKPTCSCPLWDEEHILYDHDSSDDYEESDEEYDDDLGEHHPYWSW